jgi:hypothetical protein
MLGITTATSVDLRDHLARTAPRPPEIASDAGPGGDGVPVEIHDAAYLPPTRGQPARQLDVETRTKAPHGAAAEPSHSTSTGTMAGEVTDSRVSRGRLERWFASRRVIGVMAILAVASVTTAIVVWRPRRKATQPAQVATMPRAPDPGTSDPPGDAAPLAAPVMPEQARLTLNVTPPDAQVLVNSAPLSGESPHIWRVAIGARLRIKVTHVGYVDHEQTVLIDRDALEVPIQLVPLTAEPERGRSSKKVRNRQTAEPIPSPEPDDDEFDLIAPPER